ncbi:hypothetical protein Ccrd_000133, partial [Cynara cardunculus var. scolymus]
RERRKACFKICTSFPLFSLHLFFGNIIILKQISLHSLVPPATTVVPLSKFTLQLTNLNTPQQISKSPTFPTTQKPPSLTKLHTQKHESFIICKVPLDDCSQILQKETDTVYCITTTHHEKFSRVQATIRDGLFLHFAY